MTLKGEAHIKNDKGIVILFPTGGGVSSKTEPKFKNGFRRFIDTLDSETMIYAFHHNPVHLRQIMETIFRRGPNVLLDTDRSGGLLRVLGECIRSDTTLPFQVDERYTRVGEWKDCVSLVKGDAPDDINGALTQYYRRMFGDKEM